MPTLSTFSLNVVKRNIVVWHSSFFIVTNRVSTGGDAIASVCLSVRPSVFTQTFEPSDFRHSMVMTAALMGLKVKVKGQG